MKSFDEWFNKEYSNYGDSYKELYDEKSDSYKSEFVDDRYGAFQAGQQSKQAEVDELRKRIEDIVKWVECNKASISLSEWHGYTTEEYIDADDLLYILKGAFDD